MKRFTLILLFILIPAIAVAQNGFTYQPFSVGAGSGITTAYGNTATTVNSYALNGSFNYTPTPFLSFSMEGQIGKLAGGIASDPNARSFSNIYAAIIFHADLQAGELIDYEHSDFLNGIKNIYAGTGLGIIDNNITYIQNVPAITSSSGSISNPYLKSSSNLLVPLRLGYEFKIFNGYDEPRYRVDAGYSFNTAFGRGLDGYLSLSDVKFYSYLSIGVKIGFGGPLIYRKPIPYYNF